METQFEATEGSIGRQAAPQSLERLDTEDTEAWGRACRLRPASRRPLRFGVRVVYLLHVTDRCIVEFAGLAGA